MRVERVVRPSAHVWLESSPLTISLTRSASCCETVGRQTCPGGGKRLLPLVGQARGLWLRQGLVAARSQARPYCSRDETGFSRPRPRPPSARHARARRLGRCPHASVSGSAWHVERPATRVLGLTVPRLCPPSGARCPRLGKSSRVRLSGSVTVVPVSDSRAPLLHPRGCPRPPSVL